MKKYLLAGVLFLLFATPLIAAEKESVKIKLPDGFYMYSSSIEKLQDGSERVGFSKYFVVYKNNIYSAQEAVKKIGISKLNTLFGGAKKYKILCPISGGQIGQIYSVMIEDGEEWGYKESFFTKDVKEGPAYGSGRLGSAAKCMAMPEDYKEVKKKVYTTIPQEEVDKIAKLVKDKLFDLIKDRKEITEYQLKHTELSEEYIELLDKISNCNGNLYLGIYRYVFKIEKGSRKFTPFLVFALEIAFSVTGNNVYLITSNYDGEMAIYGMLDIDGCGEEELIVEKTIGGEDGVTITTEIHKQHADNNWLLIKNVKN